MPGPEPGPGSLQVKSENPWLQVGKGVPGARLSSALSWVTGRS